MNALQRILLASILALLLLPASSAFAQEDASGPDRFTPDWESLNARKAPSWFADAKFGIFIHWGVYSVPSFCDTSTYSEWYLWWLKTNAHKGLERRFHEANYGRNFQYRQFAPDFRAELFEPEAWAKLFKRAGARYVVLTSKHHDGYCLWPSSEATMARGYPWNSAEVGPRRDLVGDLTKAVRGEGLRMGLYYSFMEWENPLYDEDKARYVDEVMLPQMRDLIARYEPDVFWPDGEWHHPDTLWRSTEFLAWLFNEAPHRDRLVVNDRWGKGLRGKVGDYYTTEYGHHAGDGATAGIKPFEECRGIGGSFAFNRAEDYDHYASRTACVRLLIDLAAQGGTLLLDIGPTADGRVPVIMQDRLIAMGEWLKENGESIYGTTKGIFRHLPWGRSTTKGNTIYLHVYDWPKDGILEVPGLMTPVTLAWRVSGSKRFDTLPVKAVRPGCLFVDLSGLHPEPHATVIGLVCDGIPKADPTVYPDRTGRIVLHPEQAEISGGARIEHRSPEGKEKAPRSQDVKKLANVGYITKPEARIVWDLAPEPGRRYKVVVERAFLESGEGGRYRIRLGEDIVVERLKGATDGWNRYVSEELGGTVRAGDAPKQRLILEPVEIRGGALINVRSVTLEPVD